MNRLAQTAVLFAAVVAVCFAAVQLGGRAFFWQLPRFEGAVNALLDSRGIVVEGLEGRWRGLNPGLFATRIRFPAGEIVGVDFELDLIESLARNRVVARRMTIADGFLTVRNRESGWLLDGGGAATGFDVAALFWHSDQVWMRGRLVARGGGDAGILYAESMLTNSDGRHRFHLQVQTQDGCADCALVVDGDIRAGDAGVVRVAAQRFTLNPDIAVLLGLSAPPGGAQLEVAGDWRRDAGGDAQARLALRLAATQTPAAPATLAAGFEAWSTAAGYRGRVTELSLASADHGFQLPGGGFRIGGAWFGAREPPFAEFWLPTFAAEAALAPVVAALGGDHPAGRWLAALEPRARIDDLTLRIDAQGLAFACRGFDAGLAAYKSVPEVRNVSFSAGGHHRALRLRIDGRDFDLAFPNWFAARGPYAHGGGSLTFAFAPDYMGLRGADIWVADGGARIAGGIALARPGDPDEAHLVATGTVDRVDSAVAREYLPTTLDAEVRRWLLDNVHGGRLSDGRLVYHGHLRTRDELPLRRTEISVRVAEATVTYHPQWPRASDVAALVEVTSRETRLHGTARAFDTALTDADVRLPRGGDLVMARFRASAPVQRLIDFAWATPIHEAMPFLHETWSGAGDAEVAADLSVPLGGQELRPGDLRVDFHLLDAGIDMADLGIRFDALREKLDYEYPARLASRRLDGMLFGRPLRVVIASDAEAVRFSLHGTATPTDAYGLLDIADHGLFDGQAEFDATYSVYPAAARPAELVVESDLVGVEVALPAPLAKTANEAQQMTASMRFLDSHVEVSTRYANLRGWLHVGDEGVRAGGLGIGAPMPDADGDRVVIVGGLDALSRATAEALLHATGDGDAVPFDWQLRDLRIGQLTLDNLELADLTVNARGTAGAVEIVVAARELDGTLTLSGDAPWQVALAELRLPAATDDGDPLDVATMAAMVAADVKLDRVFVGGEDFGTWQFGMRPAADGIALQDVVAEVKGLRIESTATAFWSAGDETRFDGTVVAGDLKDVLPLWDFAPTVESVQFESSGSLRWPGSPLNFDLARLTGVASLDLTKGRFLNVEQGGGATRLTSLINFLTIAKRMKLDFSDVFGEGVSFDSVHADLAVVDGQARFVEPARIIGTGARFLISGDAHLGSGALDLDMIATLPLHNSLPWYAAFLALANPASAVGVVVGHQMFKNQLETLTSGRYRVGGTYDDPEVEFVSMFDNDLRAAQRTAAGDVHEEGVPEQNIQTPRVAGRPTPPSGTSTAPIRNDSSPAKEPTNDLQRPR